MSRMSDARPLVYAINNFLRNQLCEKLVSKEFQEGVEISIQCLESAFNVKSSEPDLEVPLGLQEIFQKYLEESKFQKVAEPEPTPSEKSAAESFKIDGNLQMDSLNFEEAIACYTKAIRLDPRNPKYYCNRAAAANNMGRHEDAVQDCETALRLDPGYSKAFSRLGLAFCKMNKLQESVDSYKRAVDLEPDNDLYKGNLTLAQDALARSRPDPEPVNVNLDMGMNNITSFVRTIANQVTNNYDIEDLIQQVFGRSQNPGNRSSRNQSRNVNTNS